LAHKFVTPRFYQVREEWRTEVERSLKKINQLGSANGDSTQFNFVQRRIGCKAPQPHFYDVAVECLFALLLTRDPRLHALDAFFQQRLCFAT
jgi:hypothetical protein